MISFKNVRTIFKKEFLQIMRDKSVLFTNFFIPFFGLPLYIIFIVEGTQYMLAKKEAPIKDESVIFSLSYQGDIQPSLLKKIEDDPKIKIEELENSISEDEIVQYRSRFKAYNKLERDKLAIKQRVKKDKDEIKAESLAITEAKEKYLKALSNLKSKYSGKTHLHVAFFKADNESTVSYVFHSEENNVSNAARIHFEKILEEYEEQIVEDYKTKNQVEEKDLNPFHLRAINLDRASDHIAKVVGVALGGIIIFFLLIFTYPSTINTTIGERDENTFKVLLMNPISLHEVFLGKYLSIAFQGLLTLVPYSIEALIAYAWGSSSLIIDTLPALTPMKLGFLFFSTVAAAIFVSSATFLTCSLVRSKTQAQSLLTLLLFVFIIPIGIVGVMDTKLTEFTALLPIINFPMATENLLMPDPNYKAILLSIVVNLATSLAIIWFSLGAFLVQWKGGKENQGLNDILNFKRRKTKKLSPAHGFLTFGLAFLGMTYGGMAVSTLKIDIFNFLFSPLIFILGPAFLILQYSGLDFTTFFKWKGITKKYTLKLALSAISLSFAFNLLMAGSTLTEMNLMEFPVLFESNQFASYLGYFLLFSILPGFTEEILFRGVIYKSFRGQYNKVISVVVSSMLFAILHMSVFRWGHTFFLGLVLASVYERRGLISCIFLHALFNATSLFIGFNSSITTSMESLPLKFLVIPILFVLPYFLLKEKITSEKEEEKPPQNLNAA